MNAIRHVVIYKGHEHSPLLGPYAQSVTKRIEMFLTMNKYREDQGRLPWNVAAVTGENLIAKLKALPVQETLLVIPAGQSSHLDAVFTHEQLSFIHHEFFAKGGRGEFNCGSAYWVSKKRLFSSTDVKVSQLPLFEGLSCGPLCPIPTNKYQVNFQSDATQITDGNTSCTIFLSGGGSFFAESETQAVKVLHRYLPQELSRFNVNQEWENASILITIGKGAALLSMLHPYYGPDDFDCFDRYFPGSGTDWKAVQETLSPLDDRMRFIFNTMLIPLEDIDFTENSNQLSC